MKCSIPEISWHNRDPVLSVDFQPQTSQKDVLRLATGGTDTHVLIWYISDVEGAAVSIVVAADLTLHQKAVNVVRWSPSGELLASGDDESAIIVWRQKLDDRPMLLDTPGEQDREIWVVHKLLRGHLEDVYDISWCPLGNFLISGSVDNSAIIWDVHKGKTTAMLTDHKGFVQGVAWDTNNQYVCTMSSDRVFRTFDINSKKVVARSFKCSLPLPPCHPLHGQTTRLYYDDTLQSFFRRLSFSPDGSLVAVPTGYLEGEQGAVKPINAVYIYSRYSFKIPVCVLPCGECPALAVRWSPCRYVQRAEGPLPLFPLAARLVLAVATRQAVLVYDTQQNTPLAMVSNIHYTRLTDLTWSSDGHLLLVSSTDGFCSVIQFSPKELGELAEDKPRDEGAVTTDSTDKANSKDETNKGDGGDKKTTTVLKTPSKKDENKAAATPGSKKKVKTSSTPKSGKKCGESKTPSTVVAIDEVAMEAWSQDGTQTKVEVKEVKRVKEPVVILDVEPSQDIRLVYDETESCAQKDKIASPKASIGELLAKVDNDEAMEVDDDNVKKELVKEMAAEDKVVQKDLLVAAPSPVSSPLPLPKTPRRVNFITLSSPKSKKKI